LTNRILLDTHIVLWLENGDEKLRASTREMIDGRWRAGGSILISAVTTWEIAMLADTGQIHLDCPVEVWAERFLGRPGIDAVPLSWRATTRAYQLHHLEHRDLADRLLIATVLELGCEFVTYDRRITEFAAGRGRQYGLKLAT
jgi:PIN domain nuclease of toxin-antitoxin system